MRDKKEGNYCPFIKKECLEHKCALFTNVRGYHPQTGEEIDKEGCAMAWMPVLLIENSQMQRQTGAAVESFRNEVVKQQEALPWKELQMLRKIGG